MFAKYGKSCFIIIFLNLFSAALGLGHCAWLSLIMARGGVLSAAVRGLLVAVASLLSEHRLSSCSTLL